MHEITGRHFQSRLIHGSLEKLAVLGSADRLEARTDQLHPEALEGPPFPEIHRGVQRRLASHGRKQGLGPFGFYDRLAHLGSNRLYVSAVGKLRVGHDRGRVAVYEYDLIPLFTQGFAGLGAGIVEFARLSDDDRAGADQHDFVYVSTSGHTLPLGKKRICRDPVPKC